MCEAGYDLKLLLKNEENIITETNVDYQDY